MEMTDKIIANLILCYYEKKATGDFEGKGIEGDQVKLYENIKKNLIIFQDIHT